MVNNEEYPDVCHPTHKTRFSMDASSFDEICVYCCATDRMGSWGNLRYPCTNQPQEKNNDRTL